MSSFTNPAIKAVADAVFPPRCALCASLSDAPVCDRCRSEFLEVEPHLRPGGGELDVIAVRFDYAGRAAQAVRRLKYDRLTGLGPWMSSEIKELARGSGLEKADLIIPVPIHWTRLCERGFNQSELLAESFGATSTSLLRFRRTRPQVGLDLEQRLENLRGAFRAEESLSGKSVLLIDDVITSGGTARECAVALKAAGAVHVAAIAFCGGTPQKHTD